MERFDDTYVLYFDPDNITVNDLENYFMEIVKELPEQRSVICLPDALKLDRLDKSTLEQFIKLAQETLASMNEKESLDSSENIWYSSGNIAMK